MRELHAVDSFRLEKRRMMNMISQISNNGGEINLNYTYSMTRVTTYGTERSSSS